MLRIHDILGWIRIRIWIRGSMPLYGSGSGCGSGSCYFRHWPSQDANKKLIFLQVFLLNTLGRYMYIIFKDKKSKRSHKAVGIKVFLTFFAWCKKDPDPDSEPDLYLWLMDPDPGGPKTCGSGGSGSATLVLAAEKRRWRTKNSPSSLLTLIRNKIFPL